MIKNGFNFLLFFSIYMLTHYFNYCKNTLEKNNVMNINKTNNKNNKNINIRDLTRSTYTYIIIY